MQLFVKRRFYEELSGKTEERGSAVLARPFFQPSDRMQMPKNQDEKTRTLLKQTERLRHILLELPEACYDFILSIEPNTSILTRLNYAGDLRIFFDYLVRERQLFLKPANEITVEDLRMIRPRDIEMFVEYLSIYERNDLVLQNANPGKKRKLSSIRTFFRYLLRHQEIDALPTAIVDTPKLKEKPIIKLENEEARELLERLEKPNAQTKHQEVYARQTQLRDFTMITLLLGTGIRVSECVGLNRGDFDYDHNSFRVLRKGGKEAILYYSDEIKQVLLDYGAVRGGITTLPGHEDAMFLSLQRRRITARAVENLVKKHAQSAVPLKTITPHKLRSTFGTELYRATGDIYLVADVLGHRDVNTTKKHYADMSEENRKRAARSVEYKKKD